MSDPADALGGRRKSITKLQRKTTAAIELIALCQSVTDDGRLVDEEVAALRDWLETNRASNLPAIAFLSDTVARILTDGKVTPEERHDLYLAIETVLPTDIRASVRGTRTSGERILKQLEHSEKTTAKTLEALVRDRTKELQALERARNAPVDSWDFVVAGVSHEGRGEIVRKFAAPGNATNLIRDRKNRFSRHAIEVRLTNGLQIGYVPEALAADIAPLLDSGHKHDSHIKKILEGRRAPFPVVVADLYRSDVGPNVAVSEHEVPTAEFSVALAKTSTPLRPPPPAKRRWWQLW